MSKGEPFTMGTNFIPNLLAISLFLVALFIAFRAFYIYRQTRNPRLFVLGMSMGVIALTAAADFTSSNLTNVTLNTDWFLYIGQAVSLLFIFLSLLRSSEGYLRRLMVWHVCLSALLLGLLLLSPALPNFPNTIVRAVLSGSRFVFCFGILFCYVEAFQKKATRFSFLMGLSFLLLAFGYLMIFQQYFVAVSNGQHFDNIGDIIRIFGLTTLLAAVLAG
jgi:hypothetical protein